MDEIYKYQKEIDEMLADGKVSMPVLSPIEHLISYRYVYKNNPQNSNLPVYVSSPKRKLKNKTIKGYALSCYTDAEKAEERFYNILSSSPNFRKTGGDALANCVLDKNDGMMSEIGEYTHFSLFEYASCNLNSKIHIIKDL